MKVLILPIAISQWRRTGSRGPFSSIPGCVHRCATTTAHWPPLPHHHHRRRRQHVKDAAQGVLENVAEDVVQDLASSRRHHRRRRRLCAARAEMAAQLGSSVAFAVLGAQMGSTVAFGSGCEQALPGMPHKAPRLNYRGCMLVETCAANWGSLSRRKVGGRRWKGRVLVPLSHGSASCFNNDCL